LLEVAVRNLVENALRHTPEGTQIEVQGGSDGGQCWLQVCDDGGRLQETATPEPVDSLQLGHQIVQRIMALHGGAFGQPQALAPYTTCYRLSMPLAQMA